MLCGRPVMATSVAGHAEVIKDGKSGFLVPAAEPALIAEGLEKIWDNRSCLCEMGKHAHAEIRQIIPEDPITQFIEELEYWKRPDVFIMDQVGDGGLENSSIDDVYPENILNLYTDTGNGFSENEKREIRHPRKRETIITFAQVDGCLRLDPSMEKGLIWIRAIAAVQRCGNDKVRKVFSGKALLKILVLSGTAKLDSCDDDGLRISSLGNDPIILIDFGGVFETKTLQLEVNLYVE
jgi:hypothetical protein